VKKGVLVMSKEDGLNPRMVSLDKATYANVSAFATVAECAAALLEEARRRRRLRVAPCGAVRNI